MATVVHVTWRLPLDDWNELTALLLANSHLALVQRLIAEGYFHSGIYSE